jgi:CheY-like chemotaxis protein
MIDKNVKLMLVEDEATLRDLYENAFRLMGYHIETAIDGQDAVDKLEQMDELPVLIMLDVMMPRMTGFDVLNYIKNSDKFKNIPVVMLTNIGDEEAAQKALEQGAVRYLVKGDYEPKQVVEKVEETLMGLPARS